jgi:SAM-dependent MidA family methyltransferase
MSSRDPSLSLPPPPAELQALSGQLCTRIINEIDRTGPMPFDRYMALALYEPGLGYYVNGLHKFGAAGDFVTAPEQGGLFAACLARQIDALPDEIGETIVELGAGSGALAHDLLLALERPPRRYRILEPSAALRQVQQERLAKLPAALRARVEWIAAPPESPFDGVILANEVLDALPVSAFQIEDGALCERCVEAKEDRLAWALRPAGERLVMAVEALQTELGRRFPDGYSSEINLRLGAWLDEVTRSLRHGVALLIDYGYPRQEFYHPDRADGTLVCHYRHRAHFDPFVWPGLTDLSTFVDFTAVAEAACDHGLEIGGFTSQAGFLLSLEIQDFVEAAVSDTDRLRLAGEVKRLTLPAEMGEKFKVIALTRAFDAPLQGFSFMDQLARL